MLNKVLDEQKKKQYIKKKTLQENLPKIILDYSQPNVFSVNAFD